MDAHCHPKLLSLHRSRIDGMKFSIAKRPALNFYKLSKSFIDPGTQDRVPFGYSSKVNIVTVPQAAKFGGRRKKCSDFGASIVPTVHII